MGLRGGGFGGRSTFAAAGALALFGMRERTLRDPVRSFRREASAGPCGQERSSGSARRPRRPTSTAIASSYANSQTLATLADARWPEPLPALFRARLAQSFQNAGPRPLDRRPGRECELRSRSRHPRLRARRPVEGSQCRHRRLDRLAWKRADHGGPNFHPADAGRVNRRQRTWRRRWIRRLRPS